MARKKKNRTKHVGRDGRPDRPIGEPDETQQQRLPSIVDKPRFERPLPPQTPRDLSCLHSTSAHAWRSVRRRHRRVASPELPHAPRHSTRIIIPASIHSVTVPPVLEARPKTYSNATTLTSLPRYSNASIQAVPQIFTEKASQTISPKHSDASVQYTSKKITKKTAQMTPLSQSPSPPPAPSPQPLRCPSKSPLNPTSVSGIIRSMNPYYASDTAACQDFGLLPVAQRRFLVELHEFLYPSQGDDALLPMKPMLSYLDGWREQTSQFVYESGIIRPWQIYGNGTYWR